MEKGDKKNNDCYFYYYSTCMKVSSSMFRMLVNLSHTSGIFNLFHITKVPIFTTIHIIFKAQI